MYIKTLRKNYKIKQTNKQTINHRSVEVRAETSSKIATFFFIKTDNLYKNYLYSLLIEFTDS